MGNLDMFIYSSGGPWHIYHSDEGDLAARVADMPILQRNSPIQAHHNSLARSHRNSSIHLGEN